MTLYNISQSILSEGYNKGTQLFCDSGVNVFNYFFLPIIIILILVLIWKFKEEIKVKFMLYFSKRGYVRIHYIKENKRLISKLKKLDKYNTFNFKKRKYILEKMYD